MLDQFLLNLNNNQHTQIQQENQAPSNNLHGISIYEINKIKHLIKNPNHGWYVNNEVYLTSVIGLLLGPKNSVHNTMTYCSSEEIKYKLDKRRESEIKIASQWIDGTSNLADVMKNHDIDFTKTPKNLISSILASMISGNMDSHGGNIMLDRSNKFYIIDPLIRNAVNDFGVSTELFSNQINEKFSDFFQNQDNIKARIIDLIEWYFATHNETICKIYKYLLEQQSKGLNLDQVTKWISLTKEVMDSNELIIDKNIFRKLIDLMTEEEILSELSMIRDNFITNKDKIKKLGEFFESKEIFPGFGDIGVPTGHINVMMDRLEMLASSKMP